MRLSLPGLLFLICTGIAVSSCNKPAGDDTAPPLNIPVTGLALDTSSVYLRQNTTRQFTVVITPADASNRKLNWSSSNTLIATVDSAGLVRTIRAGQAVITARSVSDNTIAATARITVLTSYDLYIAGNGSVPSLGPNPLDYEACYWKNGMLTRANGGYDVGRSARAMVVSNADVYMAGQTVNANGWYMPTLWKNGNPLILTPEHDYQQYANAVTLAGNDVYVAGYIYNNSISSGIFNAFLFKISNNVITPVPLPTISGMSQSDAYGIATLGNDVYTAGGVMNNFNGYAALWKNNETPVLLSPSGTWGKAKAITVSGNDLYIAGYDGCPDFGCTMTFKVWKNNASNPVILGSIASSQFDITGIAVSGTDIYVTGYVINATQKYIATLWRVSGGVVTRIPLSDGSRNALANAVTVNGDDVFVVGYENYIDSNNEIVSKARYWRLYDATLVETYEFEPQGYQLPNSNGRSRAYAVAIN